VGLWEVPYNEPDICTKETFTKVFLDILGFFEFFLVSSSKLFSKKIKSFS
jgi:hypothetical protein